MRSESVIRTGMPMSAPASYGNFVICWWQTIRDSMRYQYVVILKKTSERATDLLSILLVFLSGGSFLLAALHSIEYDHFKGAYGSGYRFEVPTPAYFLTSIAVILWAGLAFNLLSKRKDRGIRVRYRYLLILAAIGWMGMTSFPWIGLLFFLVAFLEHQTKR